MVGWGGGGVVGGRWCCAWGLWGAGQLAAACGRALVAGGAEGDKTRAFEVRLCVGGARMEGKESRRKGSRAKSCSAGAG